MKNLKQLILSSLFVVFTATAHADRMESADYTLTKDLLGASGTSLATGGNDTLGWSWGEPIAGGTVTDSTHTLQSGYYAGAFGNGLTFTVLTTQIGEPNAPVYFRDGIRVGLAFNAPVQVGLSDAVDPASIPNGVQTVLLTNHLGLPSGTTVAVTIAVDAASNSITIRSETLWAGNTLYDIQLTQQIHNVDGSALDQPYHIYFQTMLDPKEQNVVVDPLRTALAQPTALGLAGGMTIDIPTPSLADYSTVLTSRDPLHAPLRVDPQIVQDANAKALASGGPYRTPLSIQEVLAYDTKSKVMGALSMPAHVTMTYGLAAGNAAFIRPRTLSLWALDETHRLWVKIPASQNTGGLQSVTAPVTYFSVFALIGEPDGSASDSFAFPIPWRPHGPNAGVGSGLSGTDADGITFSNLPSECTITIYTLAGDRVREIRHSDLGGLIGQEKWNVKTSGGDKVASGVYLWRVESAVDGKTGKLMVIR